jgi:hypothetical protein
MMPMRADRRKTPTIAYATTYPWFRVSFRPRRTPTIVASPAKTKWRFRLDIAANVPAVHRLPPTENVRVE